MKGSITGGLLLAMSLHANAATIDEADALFAQRQGNEETTVAARDAYLAVADSGVEGEELVRAVVGASRAYIYQGESLVDTLEGSDRTKRRTIFKGCRDNIERIAPNKLGAETPEYYYFKAACTALYAQVSGTLENLLLVGPLRDTIEDGLAVPGGDTYEGGGIKRVKAAIQSNPKAKPLPGGFYDPELALQLINEAIDSPAFGDSYDGSVSCENQRRKVNVLLELERVDEAVEVAEFAVDDFAFLLDFGLIPSEITAETVHCIEELNTILAGL